MSRSRWFVASSSAIVVCLWGILVSGWQQSAPPAGKATDRAPVIDWSAAMPPSERNALMSEWTVRKRDEATNRAAIADSLRKRVGIDLNEVPLETAIQKLAKDHELQILFDKPTLADEGVSLDAPVTVSLADISLRSALNLILEPLSLTTIVENEVLQVTTVARAADRQDPRMYDVHALLEGTDAAELKELLNACFRLNWAAGGGNFQLGSGRQPASFDQAVGVDAMHEVPVAKALSIRTTQPIHEEIAALLAELERQLAKAPGAPADPPPSDDVSTAEQAIRAKLAVKYGFKCDEESLEDVLTRIAREQALPLWIDRAKLQSDGVSLETPITLDVKDIRLESVLKLILEPQQLAAVVEDEVLKIGTSTSAAGLLITRVYDVRDLEPRKKELRWPPSRGKVVGGTGGMGSMGVPAGAGGGGGGMFDVPVTILKQGFNGLPGNFWLPKPDLVVLPKQPFVMPSGSELAELITSMILPETWDDYLGPGSIRWFRGMLVVRNTARVHADVEDLLAELRTLARRRRVDAAPPPKPADPEELTVVIYPIEDYRPSDLEKLIPETVSPHTWKGAGGNGTLNVQPSALVIRQTRAVHKEVVKLLYDVIVKPASRR